MINVFSSSVKQNFVVTEELIIIDSKLNGSNSSEDFNDQTSYSSSCTTGTLSDNSSSSDWDEDERLSEYSSFEEEQSIKSTLFEYPFNAEYEDIFEVDFNDQEEDEELSELLSNDDENDEDQLYYYEYYYHHHHCCLGGMKFKQLANMKQVKQKFKQKKINPKRRIHHRELKKQQEQIIHKKELLSSRAVYVPPTIRYADNNYYNNNNNRTTSAAASDEEAQLQQAISQSLISTDHHQYASECGIEYNLLLALTQRELTAEDYDLLLQLDNTVKKKTVSENILDSLPCCTLSCFNSSHDDDENEMPQVCEGDMCITCMCDFEEGDELRWIPKCSHIFHKDCIDNWLNNHSTCCPICRIEVKS